LVFLGKIDAKATGRAKAARCNFDTPYRISPGPHDLLVAVSVGEPFSVSRFAVVTLHIDCGAKFKFGFTWRGIFGSPAAVWITDNAGKP